jgi:hypothetical protein
LKDIHATKAQSVSRIFMRRLNTLVRPFYDESARSETKTMSFEMRSVVEDPADGKPAFKFKPY